MPIAAQSCHGTGTVSSLEEKILQAEIEATTGYIINRHRKFGEVPNVWKYSKDLPKTYSHPDIEKLVQKWYATVAQLAFKPKD